MDACQRLVDGPVAVGKMKRLEVLVGRWIRPLAQVQKKAGGLLLSRQEVRCVHGIDVRDPRAGVWQIWIGSALHVSDEADRKGTGDQSRP
jgi:hypothetical protein